MEAILVPLKLKYRVYRSFNFGTYTSRTGNSNGKLKNKGKTLVPRKRAYGPF